MKNIHSFINLSQKSVHNQTSHFCFYNCGVLVIVLHISKFLNIFMFFYNLHPYNDAIDNQRNIKSFIFYGTALIYF